VSPGRRARDTLPHTHRLHIPLTQRQPPPEGLRLRSTAHLRFNASAVRHDDGSELSPAPPTIACSPL
jgi:hypothetical protein